MFSYTNAAPPTEKPVTLSGNSGKEGTGDVTLYESKGYYYYNYKKTGVGP